MAISNLRELLTDRTELVRGARQDAELKCDKACGDFAAWLRASHRSRHELRAAMVRVLRSRVGVLNSVLEAVKEELDIDLDE